MSSKGTSSRTTRKASTTPRRKSTRKRTRKQQSAFALSLRPEHQRELFALALLGVAVLTLIFFMTGNTGGVGAVYVLGVQRLFGSGALFIPLLLGALGLAILVQERLGNTPLTGANVLGILIVAAMLVAMLEFPIHHIPLELRPDSGGGLMGFGIVELLVQAIGRPAALVVCVMLMLVGILLTFNLTVYGAITGMARWLHTTGEVLWRKPDEKTPPRKQTQKKTSEPDKLAYEAPPTTENDGDIVATPIAARPTRASLFRRNDNETPTTTQRTAAQTATPAPATEQPKPASAAADTKPAASSEAPTKKPEETTATKAEPQPDQPITEIRQEALDGFEAPVIYRPWPLPRLDLLEKPGEVGAIDDEQHRFRSRQIEETLKSFKVEVQVVGVNTGPAVTQFEVQPAIGVKISKITALQKDLALALAAPSIRIEAPIPGKSVVGIEIPNQSISVVTLREVIDSEEFEQSKGKLKLPLGKDISGNPVIADMSRMPHLLVAGSTGSGKSVAINAFLCGLLLKHTPEDLKMILVDPKMVELIVYNRVPHLLSPVVTELERVVPTLKWAVREMERRYKVFARHGCRNLESYRQLARRRADLEPMPYILIVIDELADLMMMAP
ncbi:MAG: DNA translocase FtsK, partial [Chloroflexaceae bacterium]|nr:DNA translocase FtsK [Chloroflexaceae bacterium]